uniref:Uncharacterized protein n=1 Tax=Panagrolaimus superbus TaxID=310955 RepID=A0A914XZJ4_9BILA
MSRKLNYVKGIIRDDEPVCIDDIISQIPNATSVEISESTFTDTSYAALASLNHKAKLSNIIFRNINTVLFFDLELFTDFILKNADDDCNFGFEFKLYPGNDDMIREINERFKRVEANFHKYINAVLEQRAFAKSFFRLKVC